MKAFSGGDINFGGGDLMISAFSERTARGSRFAIPAVLLFVIAFSVSCSVRSGDKDSKPASDESSRTERNDPRKTSGGPASAVDGSPSATPTPKPESPTPEETDVSGSWTCNYRFSDGGDGKMLWKLKQRGESISVSSYSYVGGNSDIWVNEEKNGKIRGNAISLYFTEKGETVSYSGTVNGDTMSGKMSFGGTWTARRTK